MIQRATPHRRGVVTIWALVVLSVLTVLAGTITWQHLASRRLIDRRVERLQSLWLARGGIELAAARLLANPKSYSGETLSPIPGSRVEIRVQPKPGDTYQVSSEARYPTDGELPVLRRAAQRFRRLVDASGSRLQPLPETGER
jgi:hypothetical protein